MWVSGGWVGGWGGTWCPRPSRWRPLCARVRAKIIMKTKNLTSSTIRVTGLLETFPAVSLLCPWRSRSTKSQEGTTLTQSQAEIEPTTFLLWGCRSTAESMCLANQLKSLWSCQMIRLYPTRPDREHNPFPSFESARKDFRSVHTQEEEVKGQLTNNTTETGQYVCGVNCFLEYIFKNRLIQNISGGSLNVYTKQKRISAVSFL